jgi:steroid 5-alpha reductase family enzyme
MLIEHRAVVKDYLGSAGFFVFNLTFVSVIQSILAFSITTPTYILVLAARLSDETDTTDIAFPCILVALVMVEWIADQQQWSKCLSTTFKS